MKRAAIPTAEKVATKPRLVTYRHRAKTGWRMPALGSTARRPRRSPPPPGSRGSTHRRSRRAACAWQTGYLASSKSEPRATADANNSAAAHSQTDEYHPGSASRPLQEYEAFVCGRRRRRRCTVVRLSASRRHSQQRGDCHGSSGSCGHRHVHSACRPHDASRATQSQRPAASRESPDDALHNREAVCQGRANSSGPGA